MTSRYLVLVAQSFVPTSDHEGDQISVGHRSYGTVAYTIASHLAPAVFTM